uniref:Uncharacterized protein n=1 Tax=Tanacetum cinerariifolium TaxID=118510 RepID=A0A6L2J0I9_TANCI|nr:hypothetical protein [Tanacetum cinerariifolium]
MIDVISTRNFDPSFVGQRPDGITYVAIVQPDFFAFLAELGSGNGNQMHGTDIESPNCPTTSFGIRERKKPPSQALSTTHNDAWPDVAISIWKGQFTSSEVTYTSSAKGKTLSGMGRKNSLDDYGDGISPWKNNQFRKVIECYLSTRRKNALSMKIKKIDQLHLLCEELEKAQTADPTMAKKGYTTTKAKTTEV